MAAKKVVGRFNKWWTETPVPNWICELSRAQQDIVKDDFHKAFYAGFHAGRKVESNKTSLGGK